MYNKSPQIYYIIGYIYIIHSKNDNNLDTIWDNIYLNANEINYSAINSFLDIKIFLNKNNLHYCA